MPHLPAPQSALFIPEKLRDQPIYPKICSMTDYIISNAVLQFEDVSLKYSGSDVVRNDVIKEIVSELGFDYVRGVMDTITNFEFSILLQFIALLNTLKGSRQGLELILRLLGFDTVVREWWEETPPLPVDTYNLIVIMNTTFVQNPAETLEKVREFAREYVYPTLNTIDFRFSLSFATKNVNFGGFTRARYTGSISTRI